MKESTILSEEILTRLDAVAEKLGIAANHLWNIFAHQAFIEGVGYTVMTFLLLITGGLTLRSSLKCGPFFDDDDEAQSSFWFMLAGLTSLIVGILCLTIGGVDFVTKIMNPEYHAWLEVRDIMKG